MKLKLLVCTRCHKAAETVPDTPANRVTELGLATVHFDNRPPYTEVYPEGMMYVTPHEKTCSVVKWVLP